MEKTITGHEAGTYIAALKKMGIAHEISDRTNYTRVTYISPRTGKSMIADITEAPYDCDGYTETVTVWEA